MVFIVNILEKIDSVKIALNYIDVPFQQPINMQLINVVSVCHGIDLLECFDIR